MRKKRKRTNKRRTYQKELLADFVMVQGVPLRDFPHGSVNVKVWVCHCARRRENENKVNGMHTHIEKMGKPLTFPLRERVGLCFIELDDQL